MKLFYLLFLAGIYAQFDWTDNGVAVRQGYHIEWSRSADLGNSGGLIVAWADSRTGSRDVYIQKVDNSGAIVWIDEGKVLAGGDGRQEDPIVISDGNDGGLISWRDYANQPVYGELYAQYIDLNGEPIWAEPKLLIGFEENNKVQEKTLHNMCSDRAGGAYVTWYAFDGNYYGVHINSDGNVTEPKVLIDTQEEYGSVSLESAGNGAAVIVWHEGDEEFESIYAQRINANGNIIEKLWNDGTPLEVAPYENSSWHKKPKVTYYSDDYVVLVWENWFSSTTNIRANYISVSGDLQFANDNNIVETLALSGSAFPRVKATSDGAFVVWLTADDDLYVQKMTSSNLHMWGSAKLLNTGVQRIQKNARLSADSNGGVFVVWEDDSSIAMQHLNSGGAISFNEPLILSNTQTEQYFPIVRNDASGAFVIWADGAKNTNGISSMSLKYDYVDINTSGTLSDIGVTILYGFGGQIEKGKTKSIHLDGQKVLIYWQDTRNMEGNPQTYGRIVGQSQDFDEEEILLSEYSYHQISPHIVKVDENLLFLGFIDENKQVMYQRLDTDLNIFGSAIPVYYDGQEQNLPYLYSNGNGYIYYGYSTTTGGSNIYLQKFSANGIAEWPIPKKITINNEEEDALRDIYPMPNGDLLIIYDVVGQSVNVVRLDANGDMITNWDNIIISEGECVFKDAIKTDDGIFIIWTTQYEGKMYGKHIHKDTSDPENLDILTLSSSEGVSYGGVVSSDYMQAENKIFSCWEEEILGFEMVSNIKCTAIDLSNLSVLNAFSIYEDLNYNQEFPDVKATVDTTLMIVWVDHRDGNFSNLYYKEVRSDGSSLSLEEGEALCNARVHQYNPMIINLGYSCSDYDGYIIFWEDDRSSGKDFFTNLYAQKVTSGNGAVMDCLGNWCGDAVVDECGVCEGDDDCSCSDGTIKDCAGICGGLTIEDECEVCGGSGIPDGACNCKGDKLDCTGQCGGSIENDICGICGGPGPNEGLNCDGTPLSIINGLIPEKFYIYQNYPNPFNPATNIRFDVAEAAHIQIAIYDITGRKITELANGFYMPGSYELIWDTGIDPYKQLSSGVYLYTYQSSKYKETRKLLFLK